MLFIQGKISRLDNLYVEEVGGGGKCALGDAITAANDDSSLTFAEIADWLRSIKIGVFLNITPPLPITPRAKATWPLPEDYSGPRPAYTQLLSDQDRSHIWRVQSEPGMPDLTATPEQIAKSDQFLVHLIYLQNTLNFQRISLINATHYPKPEAHLLADEANEFLIWVNGITYSPPPGRAAIIARLHR